MEIKRVAGVFVGLWVALGVYAASASAQSFSMEQAVAHALAHNPQLTAAQEQSLAARAQSDTARGARLPEVEARYLARRSNNPLDAFADKLNTRSVVAPDFDPAALNDPPASTINITELTMKLPLYTGGRVGAGLRAAQENESATTLQLAHRQQMVAAQTQRAYLAVQAAQRARAISTDAISAAQGHVDTTANLFRQGRLVQSDKLSAEVNLGAMRGQHEQALTRERQALNQLKLAMGLPLSTAVAVQPWQERALGAPKPLAELETAALAQRQDFSALGARVQGSRAQLEAVRAQSSLQINLQASTGWYDRDPALDNNSWSVMGVISKSLFNGGKTGHQAAAARHETSAIEAQRLALEQNIRLEIHTAFDAIAEARARLDIARANVTTARETVKLVKKRYGEGRTILLDLLQAERVLVEARNEELTATHNLEAAHVDLQLATGGIAITP